jgi:hypothetical protein
MSVLGFRICSPDFHWPRVSGQVHRQAFVNSNLVATAHPGLTVEANNKVMR